MHPFWAIQRTSGEKKGLPSNMTFQNLGLNSVTVGVVAGGSVSLTAEVTVPFLTNSIEIPKGADLVLKIDQVKQAKSKNKMTWKDYAAEKRAAEKAASKGTARSSAAAVDI